MSDDDTKDFQEDIDAVSKKLNIDINVLRDISPEEIQYLLDHCPFLQIVDTVLHYTEDEQPPEVQFIDAESGWQIFDYGDAMSASPGNKILGLETFKRQADDDDGGKGGGKGTIRNQAFLTAVEMVAIAKARGWQGIQIVDGNHLMKRAAWIKASQAGLSVSGFDASEHDKAVRDRVDMSDTEYQTLRHRSKPRSK